MRSAHGFAVDLALSALGSVALAQTPAPVYVPVQPSSHPTRMASRPEGINSPVPALLLNARKVFISNGGADAGLFPHPFTGTQDRAYAFVYKALSSGRRFDVVEAPADADIVIEIELLAPLGPLGDNKQKGTADPEPTFKLTVFDRPTHYIVWTLTQTVDQALRQETHDANFDAALNSVLRQLELVAGTTAPAQ